MKPKFAKNLLLILNWMFLLFLTCMGIGYLVLLSFFYRGQHFSETNNIFAKIDIYILTILLLTGLINLYLLLRIVKQIPILNTLLLKRKKLLEQQKPIAPSNYDLLSTKIIPMTISFAPKLKFILIISLLMFLLIFYTFIMFFISLPPSFINTGDFFNVIFTWIGLCAVTNFFILRPVKDVTINEDGVSRMEQKLSWQEPLGFLCYTYPGLFGSHTFYYELVGRRKTILWRRILPMQIASSWYKPTIPFPTYDTQMQQLIEYICARTGLSLYDLSGPEPVQVYPPLE